MNAFEDRLKFAREKVVWRACKDSISTKEKGRLSAGPRYFESRSREEWFSNELLVFLALAAKQDQSG